MHSGIVFVDHYSVCQDDIGEQMRARKPCGIPGKLDEQLKDRFVLQYNRGKPYVTPLYCSSYQERGSERIDVPVVHRRLVDRHPG